MLPCLALSPSSPRIRRTSPRSTAAPLPAGSLAAARSDDRPWYRSPWVIGGVGGVLAGVAFLTFGDEETPAPGSVPRLPPSRRSRRRCDARLRAGGGNGFLPCAALALVSFSLVDSAAAQFSGLHVPPAARNRDDRGRGPGRTTTGDGDYDLFATTYGDTAGNENNRLLENRGAAGFAVIEVPELQLPRQLSTSSAWGDFDDDGDADVFIACEADTGVSLFRNDGAASFVDVTPPVLRSRSGCYSSVWVDTDLDGDLDLGVASRDGAKLYRNDGEGRFADITRPPLDVPAWCMEWTDFDRDGGSGCVSSERCSPSRAGR